MWLLRSHCLRPCTCQEGRAIYQTFCTHSKGSGNQEKPGLLHSCGSLTKDQRGKPLHSYPTRLSCFFFLIRILKERLLRCRPYFNRGGNQARERVRPLPAKISISSSTSHCPRQTCPVLGSPPAFQIGC